MRLPCSYGLARHEIVFHSLPRKAGKSMAESYKEIMGIEFVWYESG